MTRLLAIAGFIFALCVTPMTVMASSAADQVTTTRALQRGAILRPADVTGPYAQDDYVGLELTRSVRAGAVLTLRHVREPLLVKRNETVTLVFRQGALSMETTGRALAEGGEGARIAVMNSASRKRIIGRIIGPGTVEVTP
ncbi:MAG: flagellar basal body P-ring formation chaperone FlgA [Pseudomonadota bacterium]